MSSPTSTGRATGTLRHAHRAQCNSRATVELRYGTVVLALLVALPYRYRKAIIEVPIELPRSSIANHVWNTLPKSRPTKVLGSLELTSHTSSTTMHIANANSRAAMPSCQELHHAREGASTVQGTSILHVLGKLHVGVPPTQPIPASYTKLIVSPL